jgi:hydroxypyruvate isomerase
MAEGEFSIDQTTVGENELTSNMSQMIEEANKGAVIEYAQGLGNGNDSEKAIKDAVHLYSLHHELKATKEKFDEMAEEYKHAKEQLEKTHETHQSLVGTFFHKADKLVKDVEQNIDKKKLDKPHKRSLLGDVIGSIRAWPTLVKEQLTRAPSKMEPLSGKLSSHLHPPQEAFLPPWRD